MALINTAPVVICLATRRPRSTLEVHKLSDRPNGVAFASFTARRHRCQRRQWPPPGRTFLRRRPARRGRWRAQWAGRRSRHPRRVDHRPGAPPLQQRRHRPAVGAHRAGQPGPTARPRSRRRPDRQHQRLNAFDEEVRELGRHRCGHDEPFGTYAALAGIAIARLDRGRNIGVVENDEGVRPAELKHRLLRRTPSG